MAEVWHTSVYVCSSFAIRAVHRYKWFSQGVPGFFYLLFQTKDGEEGRRGKGKGDVVTGTGTGRNGICIIMVREYVTVLDRSQQHYGAAGAAVRTRLLACNGSHPYIY